MGLLSRASADNLPDSGPIKAKVTQFFEIYNDLNCIVLKANGREDFCREVQEILGRTGTVIQLPSDNPLILLRGTVDRELMAHRLSKTLNAQTVVSFEAKSPENLIKQIGKV